MKKIVIKSIGNATMFAEDDPVLPNTTIEYDVIDIEPTIERWSDWEFYKEESLDFQETIAVDVHRTLFTSTVMKTITRIPKIITEQRRLFRIWSDPETGQRMAEILDTEYRTHKV